MSEKGDISELEVNGPEIESGEPLRQPPVDGALPADHPLLKDAQEKLRQTLLKKCLELDEFLTFERNARERATDEREQIGLQLFTQQETHRSVQEAIQKMEKEQDSYGNKRKVVDRKIDVLRYQAAEKSTELNGRDRERAKRAAEAAETSRIMTLLKEEQERIKHQLLVSKRAASKAEQVLREREEMKIAQDIIVDNLTVEIDRLQSELRLYEERLERHRHEDDGVKQLLAEALGECDSLLLEKKQLISQWKGALAILGRHDESVTKAKADIAQILESQKTFDNRISGTRKALDDSLFQRDGQLSVIDSLEKKSSVSQEKFEELNGSKESSVSALALLQKATDAANSDFDNLLQKGRLLVSEGENISRNTREITTEIQQLDSDAMEVVLIRSADDRVVSNRAKETVRARRQAEETELSIAQLRNEIAKAKMAHFEVAAFNSDLKEKVADVETSVVQENVYIRKSEEAFNSREIELKKRQKELEVLNKKYSKIMLQLQALAGTASGELGPLEATIHNLNSNIRQTDEEIAELKQGWMKSQNELVLLSKKVEEIQQILSQNQTRRSIFERKLSSLDQQCSQEDSQARDLKKSCSILRSKMELINSNLLKSVKNFQAISDATKESEIAFRQQLKDAERESIQLADKVERIKIDADQASEDLIEAERQVLLWQNKLHIAKETRKTVDPSVGGGEIKQLEWEVQKLHAQKTTTLKRQETLVQEITFAIERQSDLNDTKLLSYGKKDFSHTLKSQISDLRKRVDQINLNISECEESRMKLLGSISNASARLKELSSREFNQKAEALRALLQSKSFERHLTINHVVRLQNRLKRYQELLHGSYRIAIPDMEKRSRELQKQVTKGSKLSKMQHSAVSV